MQDILDRESPVITSPDDDGDSRESEDSKEEEDFCFR
jgi:hypothetical protein